METIRVESDGFSLSEKKKQDPAPQPSEAAGKTEAGHITASVSHAFARAPQPRPSQQKADIADDDRVEHQRLVITLSRYGQSKRFAEYLRSLDFNLSVSHLRRQSLADLQDTLERVRISAQNRSINNLLEDTVFGAVSFGEIVVSNSALGEKLYIKGLTQALRADETFLDCIEALSLDYGALTHAGPELRMVYSVISAVGKVHGVNAFMKRRAELMEQNGQEEEQEPEESTAQHTEPQPDDDDDDDDAPEVLEVA